MLFNLIQKRKKLYYSKDDYYESITTENTFIKTIATDINSTSAIYLIILSSHIMWLSDISLASVREDKDVTAEGFMMGEVIEGW